MPASEPNTEHRNPRVVIHPHPRDPALLVLSFDGGTEYVLSRRFARNVADEIASVCPPPAKGGC
jgi:hypothetical protein